MDKTELSKAARPVLDAEFAEWRACVGRSREQHAVADAEVLRRFARAAGLYANVEARIPTLAHWALFMDAVEDDRIGADGHPRRGDFLPDVHLSRRMFAASQMVFRAPLRLGETTRCVSTIRAVDHKRGRSGDLVFVKVSRDVFQRELLCTTEEQTLVYRPDGGKTAALAETVAGPGNEEQEIWTPGPVQLFRFSAVTFNSHRIHYDLPYAQSEEGYPGLVVHGPFTAVKLLDFACRHQGGFARSFSFRGVAPMFASQPIYLGPTDTPGSYVATRCDGSAGMTATIEFE